LPGKKLWSPTPDIVLAESPFYGKTNGLPVSLLLKQTCQHLFT